jgi:hypothetical protein
MEFNWQLETVASSGPSCHHLQEKKTIWRACVYVCVHCVNVYMCVYEVCVCLWYVVCVSVGCVCDVCICVVCACVCVHLCNVCECVCPCV